MNEITEFVNVNPFISFIIITLMFFLIKYMIYVVPNRILRSRNIKNKGWPPEHLDADGDFKSEDND